MSYRLSRATSARPAAAPASQTGRRLVPLDALRGLMLVLMAVNHIPSDLHVVTDHPFGFVSAAEGFVFLSGLMAGLVYTRKFLREGLDGLRQACFARAWMIYRHHLFVFFAVFTGVVGWALWTGRVLPNAPAQMLMHPAASLLAGTFLLQQPPLLDILPMYCGFVLATPWLLRACELGQQQRLLWGCAALWALVNAFCPQVPVATPFISGGALNICAWQLLFVVGLICGHRWAQSRPPLPRPKGWQLPVLAGAAFVLFAVRHAWISPGVPAEVVGWLNNKNNLAPLRLVNTALLFWLIYGLVTWRPQWFSWPGLALLGRASMAVFTAHVLMAYVIQANPSLFDGSIGARAAGTGLMLITLFAVAAWQTRHERATPDGRTSPAHSALASPR